MKNFIKCNFILSSCIKNTCFAYDSLFIILDVSSIPILFVLQALFQLQDQLTSTIPLSSLCFVRLLFNQDSITGGFMIYFSIIVFWIFL